MTVAVPLEQRAAAFPRGLERYGRPAGIALLILMAAPYFDKNPSMRPENRKLAILMFTTFMMFWSILVLSGSFFRGPSFEWVWPWTQTCSTPIHPDKTCLFFEF